MACIRASVRPSKVSVAWSSSSGRASGEIRKRRESQPLVHEQALAVALDGSRDGQLGRREFEGESMFFVDLRIAPARRAIELQHPQGAVVVAQLIDAIFVAVESEQAPGRLQPDAFRSVENGARVEVIERRGCRMRHSHRRTLM